MASETSDNSVFHRVEEKRWQKEYTTINGTPIMFEIQKGKVTDLTGVVPDSSKCIAKEADYCLYNVIVMSKVVDSYKQSLRENKFHVREYLPEEEVTDEAFADLNEQVATELIFHSPLCLGGEGNMHLAVRKEVGGQTRCSLFAFQIPFFSLWTQVFCG